MTSPNQHLNLGTRSHQLPPLMNITTEILFSLIQHPLFPLDYLTIPMNIQAYYIISHFKKKDSFKITPPSSSTFCSPPIFFFFFDSLINKIPCKYCLYSLSSISFLICCFVHFPVWLSHLYSSPIKLLLSRSTENNMRLHQF